MSARAERGHARAEDHVNATPLGSSGKRLSSWILVIFGTSAVWSLISGTVALADGRPGRGLDDFAFAIFALAVIAQNRGWLSLRASGTALSGAIIARGVLLLTHPALQKFGPLMVVPAVLILAGIAVGVWYWQLTQPDRLLSPEAMQRTPELQRAITRATLVLRDGKRIVNVPLFAGRIASRAGRRLADPRDVIEVIAQPRSSRAKSRRIPPRAGGSDG